MALGLRGKLVATCELAGLAALGASAAALMWAVVTPKGAIVSDTAPAAKADSWSSDVATRLSRLDDPFTRGGATQAAALADASGFILHATRATGDGGGTAILSPAGGQQGAYLVGEEITPGVSLAQVASDHVEIDVGGRRMRVAFPGATTPVISMAGSLPADYTASAKASAIPSLPGLPLQPVNRNGAAAGFEVMPHADSAVLASAGLRPGDILLSVNGVSAVSADLAAYRQQLLSGQPVDIRFERNGQVLTTRLGKQ